MHDIYTQIYINKLISRDIYMLSYLLLTRKYIGASTLIVLADVIIILYGLLWWSDKLDGPIRLYTIDERLLGAFLIKHC